LGFKGGLKNGIFFVESGIFFVESGIFFVESGIFFVESDPHEPASRLKSQNAINKLLNLLIRGKAFFYKKPFPLIIKDFL
jgi:hypothetical protein